MTELQKPSVRTSATIGDFIGREALTNGVKWAGGRVARLLDAALGSRANGRLAILLYHRTAPVRRGAPRPTLNVSPERFEQQLVGLLHSGYRFLSLTDVLNRAARRVSVPPRSLVLTFDDGFDSVHVYAWPVLKKLEIPATIFLATAFIDSREPFPFDDWGCAYRGSSPAEAWRPLTWDACRDMEASGLVEIGTHSHSHASFKRNPGALRQDLQASLALLAEHLGSRPRPFAFPFGSVKGGFADSSLVEAARESGVTCSLTTEIELVDLQRSPFEWGRLEVIQSDPPGVVRAKVEGWYNWMTFAREGFRVLRRYVPAG